MASRTRCPHNWTQLSPFVHSSLKLGHDPEQRSMIATVYFAFQFLLHSPGYEC